MNNTYYNFDDKNSKPKKTKKSDWTYKHTIVFIFILIWTIGAVLGSLSFFNACNSSSSNAVAYADEVIAGDVYFQGSNVFFPCSSVKRDKPLDLRPTYENTCSLTFRITKSSGDRYLLYLNARTTYQTTQLVFYNEIGTLFGSTITVASTGDTLLRPESYVHYYGGYATSTSSYTLYPNYYSIIVPCVETGFDPSKVVSVTFGNRADRYSYAGSVYTDGLKVSNYITYYDDAGKGFRIYVYAFTEGVNSTWRETISFTTRSYLLSSVLSDSTIYQNGYSNGLDQGRLLYEGSGYQDGYNTGFAEGERAGFNDGASQGISFLGLFSALIDAPVKAVTGLFNFELLGVNLMSFVSAVFTCMVVIILLKMIFGGGKNG